MKKQVSLNSLYESLGCQRYQEDGISWFECCTERSRAVLLLHGVTGVKTDMLPLVQHYTQAGYAAYSVDLPGHGNSTMVLAQSYDELVVWLRRAFEVIGRTPDVLVSNSFASSIVYHALRTGALPPMLRIVMACPTPETSKTANLLQAISCYMPQRPIWWLYNSAPARWARVKVLLQAGDLRAWQWLMTSEKTKYQHTSLADSNHLTSLLYRCNPYTIGVPIQAQRRITLLLGDKDNVVTKNAATRMQALLPHAELIHAPHAGHILHFEAVEYYPVSLQEDNALA